MSSVDQRVVEMQFNNQQFEQGIQTSLKSLDSLKKGLDLNGSSKSLTELEKAGKHFSMTGMESAVDTIANRFSILGIVGMTAIQNIANSAVEAGKRMLHSLTIAPISEGFSEYELKMGSVQTIMASTGESLETVMKYLEELNAYSDKTIYSFSDMTTNIGKFTNAGVKLEDAVKAIQGISNLAAVSGANANEASRAMYNFAQSLSAGYVKLIDWKSIENANMATVEFKTQLLESAVAAGTLTKTSDGMYRTLKGHTISATKNFNEYLSDQWLTTDVLIDTLGDYSDETTEIGKKAFAAAQDVKTFTQLLDTLKEAVASGWAYTFEMIFGDFEEAKELWTGISNFMNKIIEENANSRNDLLEAWKDAGGRDMLIQGLADAFHGLYGIILAVKDALAEIIPAPTVEQLLAFSEGIQKLGKNIKNYFMWWSGVSTKWNEIDPEVNTGKAEQEIESFDKTLKKGMKGEEITDLQKKLVELGYLTEEEVDGIFGPKTEAAIKAFQKDHDLIVDGIFGEKTFASLSEALGLDGDGQMRTTLEEYHQFGDVLNNVRDAAKGVFAVVHMVFQVFKFGATILGHVIGLLAPIANAFLVVAAGIGNCLANLDAWLEDSGIFTDWLAKVDKFLAPIGAELQKAGQAIMNFFGFGPAAEAAEGVISTFPQLWSKICQSVRDSGVWDRIVEAFGRIREAFAKITPVLRDYYEKAKAYLGEKFSALLGKIAEVLPKAIEGVGNFLVSAFDFIAPVIEKIPNHIAHLKDFVVNVKNFIVNLWNSLGMSDRIGEGFAKLKGILGKIPGALGDFITSLGNAISAFFSADVDDTTSFLDQLKQRLSAFGNVGGWITDAWNKIKAVLSKVINGSKQFLSKVDMKGVLYTIATVLGVFYTFSIVRSISQITSSVNSFFKESSKLFKTIRKRIKGEKGAIQTLGETILEIAIAIGIVVAAIAVLGNLDPNVLKQGGIALAAIIGTLVLITALAVKFVHKDETKALESLGKSLQSLALTIGILVASIWLIGGMNPKRYIAGLAGLTVLMVALGAFMAAVNKIGKSSDIRYKGLIGLSVTIGILTGILWLIGGMKPSRYVKGLLGLVGIMATLGIFMAAVNKIGGSAQVQYKGLFGLSVAIGLLAIIMRAIGGMKVTTLAKGLAGLVLIMASLGAFMILVSKFGGYKVKWKSLLGVTVAVAALAVVAGLLGQMKLGDLAKGIVGLIAIMGSLMLLVKATGKLDIKSGISMLASCVGLVVLMAAFSKAINGIKDVDTSKIIAFSAGLTGFLLGFGGFLALSKVAGFSGVAAGLVGIVGLVAVITAIVAAFGALAKIPGFNDFMKGGAESIGEIIGTFIGSLTGAMQAANIKSMAKGLSGLEDVDIDEGALQEVLGCAKMISDFENQLPDKSPGDKIVDFITGSPLQNLTKDMVTFSVGFNAFAYIMSSLEVNEEELDGKTAFAIQIANMILELEAGIPEKSKADKVVDWITGSPVENLSADMVSFAVGFNAFAAIMSAFEINEEDISGKTAFAIEMANAILDLEAGIPPKAPVTKAIEWITGSPVQDLSSDMVSFATGFNAFAAIMSGIELNEDDISGKTTFAIDIANALLDLEAGIPPKAPATKAIEWITGSPLQDLSSDMTSFAEGFNNFATVMSGLDPESIDGLDDKTEFAVGIAKAINGLQKELPDVSNGTGVGNSISKLVDWATQSPLEKFSGDMTSFAEGFNNFATAMSGVNPSVVDGLDEKTEFAVKIATAINDLNTQLPDRGTFDGIQEWFSGTPFENLTGNMDTFAEGFNNFAVKMGLIKYDTDLDTDITNAVNIMSKVAGFFKSVDEMGIEKNKGAIEKWFTGDTSTGTLFTQLGKLIESITGEDGAMKKLEGLGESSFDTDIDMVKKAMENFASLLTYLNSDEVNVGDYGDHTELYSDYSQLDSVLEYFRDVISHIGTLRDITKDFSIEDFNAILAPIGNILMGIAQLSAMPSDINLSESVQPVFDDLFALFTSLSAAEVDPASFAPISQAISTITALAADPNLASITPETFANLKISIQELQELLSGQGDVKIDTASFLSGFDAATIIATVTMFTASLTTSLVTSAASISSSVDAFNGAGSDLGAALSKGMGESPDTSGISEVCRECLSKANSFTSSFTTSGKNMSAGIAQGIRNGRSGVVNAAAAVVRAAISAANAAAAIHSPSREFAKIGMYSDLGLSKGLLDYSRVVNLSAKKVTNSVLDTAKGSLSALSGIITDDIDADPVIRPVLDLSNVASGARAIGGIIPRSSTIDVGATAEKASAASASMSAARASQNGGQVKTSSEISNNDSSVNFTGNTFNVRSDQDVHNLASEIAALTKQQQRSMGAAIAH